MTQAVQSPLPIYLGNDGKALQAGYLWFGAVDLNPETNPVNMFWDAELTQPAAQPIRTINGFPSRNGTAAALFANSDHSINIRDEKGQLVQYVRNSLAYTLEGQLRSTTDADLGSGQIGDNPNLSYPSTSVGGQLNFLRERISPLATGGLADGSDSRLALLAAANTGKIVDLGGRTWSVDGELAPGTFKAFVNGRIVQLSPTGLNRKTLNLVNRTDFFLEDLIIDRGGAPGYTVGELGGDATYAGIRLNQCSNFSLKNVRVTNGGRGTAIAIFNSTDFSLSDWGVSEHYWQEANPGTPVVTDDIIQPAWFVSCSRFSVIGGVVVNCTSGAPGNPAVNVPANRVRNFSRIAWGACNEFTVSQMVVKNVAQCYDFTGSDGNHRFVLSDCLAIDAGLLGFKLANSSYRAKIRGCDAIRSNQYGFFISGMTEPGNPLMIDLDIADCRAIDTGALSSLYAGNTYGFAVLANATIDVTYPRSVTFSRCDVIDRQVSPTTTYGFFNTVAPREFPATDFGRPQTIRTIECKVDVPGMPSVNQFQGIHHPHAILTGDSAGADTVPTSTWTNLNFDAADMRDPSGLHNPSLNPDILYIKEPGGYIIKGQATFSSNATGERGLRITVNGGNVDDSSLGPAHPTQPTLRQDVWHRHLLAGDQIRLQAWQNSGGNLTCNRDRSFLSVIKVF